MFLVRSAFWLTTAFAVIAPMAGNDAGTMARATGEEIAQRGAGTVTAHLLPESCGSVECVVGRAIVAEALAPQKPAIVSATGADESLPAKDPLAPVPPQRPSWAY